MARYRLTESKLRGMIREAVKSVILEQQLPFSGPDDPKFYDYLMDRHKKGLGFSPEYMNSRQLENMYKMFMWEWGEKNFTGDGMRVGDCQGFKNDNGEIEWHGRGTINGWRSDNSRWTPENN